MVEDLNEWFVEPLSSKDVTVDTQWAVSTVGRDGLTDVVALCYEKQRAEEIAALRAELEEQARLNGMGSEREAKLLAEVTELNRRHELNCGALSKLQDRIRQLRETQARYVEALEKIRKTNGLQYSDIFRICDEALAPGFRASDTSVLASDSQEAEHCPCGPDMSSPDCQIHADHIPDVGEKVVSYMGIICPHCNGRFNFHPTCDEQAKSGDYIPDAGEKVREKTILECAEIAKRCYCDNEIDCVCRTNIEDGILSLLPKKDEGRVG